MIKDHTELRKLLEPIIRHAEKCRQCFDLLEGVVAQSHIEAFKS